MKKVVLGIVVLAVVGGVRAGVVAGWEMSGVELDVGEGLDAPGAPYLFSATTSETGRVSAQLTLGDGVNPSTSVNHYGFKIPTSDKQTSLIGAITNNHFIEFSITVDVGYELNLDSIEMNGQASGSGCSNHAYPVDTGCCFWHNLAHVGLPSNPA